MLTTSDLKNATIALWLGYELAHTPTFDCSGWVDSRGKDCGVPVGFGHDPVAFQTLVDRAAADGRSIEISFDPLVEASDSPWSCIISDPDPDEPTLLGYGISETMMAAFRDSFLSMIG